MSAKPQSEWPPIRDWRYSTLKKENVATGQAMCTFYGKNWTHLPRKGRRNTYVELLMEYKATWVAERANGNGDQQDAAEQQQQQPQQADLRATMEEVIAAHGVRPLAIIGHENENDIDDIDDIPDIEDENVNIDNVGNDEDVENDGDDVDGGEEEEKGIMIGLIAEPPAENEVKLWLQSIIMANVNMGLYWAVFESHGFESMEAVEDIDMSDLVEMDIRKIGHRKLIIKYIRKYVVQVNGGGVEAGGGIVDGVGDADASPVPPLVSAALYLDFEGNVYNALIMRCAVGKKMSDCRVIVARVAGVVRFTNIMQKLGANGKKINTGYSVTKNAIFKLMEWKMGLLTNYFDPVLASREGASGRGGARYANGDFAIQSLSTAHNALAPEKRPAFKRDFIVRYKDFIDWRRFALRMGDLDQVQTLGLLE